jgi:hypothetical protein
MTTLKESIPTLMALREREGAHTPRGYVATILIERILDLESWERQSWVCDPRQTPHYWIKKYLDRLAR